MDKLSPSGDYKLQNGKTAYLNNLNHWVDTITVESVNYDLQLVLAVVPTIKMVRADPNGALESRDSSGFFRGSWVNQYGETISGISYIRYQYVDGSYHRVYPLTARLAENGYFGFWQIVLANYLCPYCVLDVVI